MANQNQELRAIRPKEAIALLTRCMKVGRPAMLWGPPGIGKSDLIQQIGDSWVDENGKPAPRPVIDLRLLLMEPTDIKGIPYYNPETREMRWAKPSELPAVVTDEDVDFAATELAEAQKAVGGEGKVSRGDVRALAHKLAAVKASRELQNAILFLDEINASPQSVQAAAYQLVLNRKVGEYHLPDGVSIVAAGNRETDKAVTFRMPSALANRLIHFEMTHNYDDWETWAIDNRISSDVIGYLKAHPNHLFNFDPKSSGKAFATPRSWAFVSQLVTEELGEHLNSILVEGTVGQGVGLTFMQHCRLKGRMPNPKDILTGKVTDFAPDSKIDVAAKYSLMVGLCYQLEQMQEDYRNDPKMKESDWSKVTDTFLEFVMGKTKGEDHFSEEMVIMGAIIALRKYDIDFDSETKTFTKFFERYHEWIVGGE